MKRFAIGVASALALAVPTGAQAAELFAGLHIHDVKLPLDKSGIETGVDFSLGIRGGSIGRLGRFEFQPYVFGAVNSAGNTDYAAAGISAKLPLGRAGISARASASRCMTDRPANFIAATRSPSEAACWPSRKSPWGPS